MDNQQDEDVPDRLDLRILRLFQQHGASKLQLLRDDDTGETPNDDAVLLLIRHGSKNSDELWKSAWDRGIAFCVTDLNLEAECDKEWGVDGNVRAIALCLNPQQHDSAKQHYYEQQIEPLVQECNASLAEWQGSAAWKGNHVVPKRVSELMDEFEALVTRYSEFTTDVGTLALVLLTMNRHCSHEQELVLFSVAQRCMEHNVVYLWIQDVPWGNRMVNKCHFSHAAFCFPTALPGHPANYSQRLETALNDILQSKNKFQKEVPQSFFAGGASTRAQLDIYKNRHRAAAAAANVATTQQQKQQPLVHKKRLDRLLVDTFRNEDSSNIQFIHQDTALKGGKNMSILIRHGSFRTDELEKLCNERHWGMCVTDLNLDAEFSSENLEAVACSSRAKGVKLLWEECRFTRFVWEGVAGWMDNPDVLVLLTEMRERYDSLFSRFSSKPKPAVAFFIVPSPADTRHESFRNWAKSYYICTARKIPFLWIREAAKKRGAFSFPHAEAAPKELRAEYRRDLDRLKQMVEASKRIFMTRVPQCHLTGESSLLHQPSKGEHIVGEKCGVASQLGPAQGSGETLRRLDKRMLEVFCENVEKIEFVFIGEAAEISDSAVLVLIRHGAAGSEQLWKQLCDRRIAFCVTSLDLDDLAKNEGSETISPLLAVSLTLPSVTLTDDSVQWYTSHIEPLAEACFRCFSRWEGGVGASADHEVLRQQLLNLYTKYSQVIANHSATNIQHLSLVLLVPIVSSEATAKHELYDIADVCQMEKVPFIWVEGDWAEPIRKSGRQVVCFPATFTNDEYHRDLKTFMSTMEVAIQEYHQEHPQSELLLSSQEVENIVVARRDYAAEFPSAKRRKTMREEDSQNGVDDGSDTAIEIDSTVGGSDSCTDSILDGASAGVDGQDRPALDEELIKLEEEIALLQDLVDAANDRRRTVEDDLVQAQAEQKRLVEHVADLEQRAAKLAEKESKQVALQQEMNASIKLSEARLARLSASDLTVEEIERLAADQDVQETIVNELQLQNVVNEDQDIQETLFVNEPRVQTAATECVADKFSDGDRSEDNSDSVPERNLMMCNPTILSASVAAEKQLGCALEFFELDSFWDVSPREDILASSNLLPSIASKELMRSILDLAAREILILDRKADQKGRHRREAMWYTCIDARALCRPFSLKHIQDEPSLEAPHRDIDPRSDSIQIDPNVALCPYEISGSCADPDCVYQHLVQRESGALLPRELLPLPRHRRSHSKASRGTNSQPGQTVARFASGDEKKVEDKSDFIALPPPVEEDWISDRSFDPSLLKTRGGFWWMEEGRAADLRKLPKDTPISEVLTIMGLRFFKSRSKQSVLSSLSADGIPPLSFGGTCKAVGMLIDCVRLALHSGRFDICRSLQQPSMINVGWLLDQTSSSEKESGNLLHQIVFLCREMIDEAIKSSYAFNSKETSPARAAIDTQVILAVFYYFMQHLDSFFENGDVSERTSALQKWLEIMKKIDKGALFALPGNFPSDTTFDDVLKKVCSVDAVDDTATEFSDPRFDSISNFVDGVQASLYLKGFVSESKSTRDLVDRILYPSLDAARKLFHSSLAEEKAGASAELALSKGITVIAYVVLGAVEWMAGQIRGDSIDSLHAELCQVCHVVDKILMEIRSYGAPILMLDLLLSPVFASNISLAVTSKVYDRALRRLEGLLIDYDDDANLNAMQYSELLWSQLAQLRASLPDRVLDSSDADSLLISLNLPTTIVDSHEFLASYVSQLEVCPHHFSLANDWNIVAALIKSKTSKERNKRRKKVRNRDPIRNDMLRKECLRLMTPSSTHALQRVNFLKKQPLQLNRFHGAPLEIRPAIPHSILLTGSTTLELNLSLTSIRRLPHHFGNYFPNLKTLRLYDNHLDELPETMHHLTSLETLDVGKNLLVQLPSQFSLPSLKVLKAEDNRLTQLPITLKGCKRLERLDLSKNPAPGSEIYALVAQLPSLCEIRPKPS